MSIMGSLSEEDDQYFDTREDMSSVSDSGSDSPEHMDSDFGVVNTLPSQSSLSHWLSDARELYDGTTEENCVCRIRNLDDGTEFIVDELGQDGMLGRLREVGSNRLLTLEEFERSLGLSPLVQQVMQRDAGDGGILGAARKQVKKGWLRRLGSVACIVDGGMIANDSYSITRARTQKVRVRSHRKGTKELSALYMGQDVQAHEGSILTMKFSPNGQYLASAGEDGIVRVWQVVESERSEDFEAADCDPSCVYFTTNNPSELVPVCMDKENKGKLKGVRKTSDSACVIFPQKVFQILERPIHEFLGHCGEVLDLSWSRNKYLLSSSVDKTVRLWQVGCDQCLKVFSHNNYGMYFSACWSFFSRVQFNPVDDNYFISSSIDGKVRIWAIPGCQVVDWIDITEIVTALCFRPDGKGVVVGSMTGNCRFYDASDFGTASADSDNRLQLYAQVCLQSKKKSPLKRITGLQFSPGDSTKMMVTFADSQVRILQGVDTIYKFRGLHNSGSQISASFTSDGRHVVSASDDSNVYMWNYITSGDAVREGHSNLSWVRVLNANYHSLLLKHFPLNHGIFSKSLPKGSVTWPEEKLLPPSSMVLSSAMLKSQYKFLNTSLQSTHGSPHAWGLVIVTAGWDGRIRFFQNYGLPIRL
ncbi:hypothetical protein Patl1_00639 [Pistacia atlantica]|uniref:Uncharacterized protein n=1 Tax=Pistacia atlantica TaxID=434234 RepID=A0ACC1C8P3_9ROSI|nr:hypothetical protein Patl1_00639 [Pistacia atlantica]